MSKKGFDCLPQFYDDNMVGFFSQGPSVVFVYWELSGSQWETVVELGGPVLVRLYQVRESENFDYEYIPVREAEPPPATNNWYFDRLEPDSTYSFEVGCKLPDGSFFPLVRSERITTPPEPRFDAMPKQKEVTGKTVENLPEIRDPGGLEGIAEGSLELSDVFESMPFYMGYDTNQ
ncbi:MAG: DUF4912 domain-containing protein [Bacillota bacterium]